ncbi:MAG: hypothetical protein A2287_03560 [Candidatus Melainabacteria bacterium RIFOXYA12_FULL_32_12]|nr:MAG: hypothetical protein A2255_10905 [Candidatus Melainabacteria bacterium RIFOXYA2_FULL_32_9]OGI30084.1 MAG: hypothetical protein A2287_03560 [Candidatus Melainabacteria bacterium RIFOXYA12_FULL_32_12]
MKTGLNNFPYISFKDSANSTFSKRNNYNAPINVNSISLLGSNKDSVMFSNNTVTCSVSNKSDRFDKSIMNLTHSIDKNISFTGNIDPNTSQSFRILKDVLDNEFKNSLDKISPLGKYTTDHVKKKLIFEYGFETANEVQILGNNTGFNPLTLLIPGGVYNNGTAPDVFPVITSYRNLSNMGGDHWQAERWLDHIIKHNIKKVYPDFSFEKIRKDLGIDPIKKNKELLSGTLKHTNHAMIHGFLIYDGKNNNYIVLDNNRGIKDFVKRNQRSFDSLTQRFNIKAVIIGGEPVAENIQAKEKKEKEDLINQLRGELYISGTDITEFSNGKNQKEICSTSLIELLTTL